MRGAGVVGGSRSGCDDGRVEMGNSIVGVLLSARGGGYWDKRVLRTVCGRVLPHAWVCC